MSKNVTTEKPASFSNVNLSNYPNLSRNLFFTFCALAFIKMLVLNFLTPLGLDDGQLSGSVSVLDALRREHENYMTVNGRSIAHFFIRIFRMFPKDVFNVFSSLVFVCFTLLIYKLANPKKAWDTFTYLFIVFSIWLFTIFYGQTVLWMSGAINYLWGATIILSFLLPYCHYISGKTVFKHKYPHIVGMFFLGVIAGWCNENTSGGMIMIAFLTLVHCKIFKQVIKGWMISGLLGSIIGFLFMILAPGNYLRAGWGPPDDRHILVIFSDRVTFITSFIQNDFAIPIMIFIVLVIMQIVSQRDWKRIYISVAFFIASIATAYAMVMSPYIGGRPMFGAMVFMIIACAHCLGGLTLAKPSYKIAVASFICILAFHFSTTFIVAFDDIWETSRRANDRIEFIESEVARGNLNVLLPFCDSMIINVPYLTRWNPRWGFWDLTHDPAHDMNRCYAFNYGLESIRWE